jgi:predicted small metal-binding protein
LEQIPRPTAINLGCGVTAHSKEDVMRLLNDHVYSEHGPLAIVSCIEDATMDQIEQNHARPTALSGHTGSLGDPV